MTDQEAKTAKVEETSAMETEDTKGVSREDKQISPSTFAPKPTEMLYNPHTIKCVLDTPCPTQSTDKIEDDYEVNNWVLNHLPFKTYEQKVEFVKVILADQRKAALAEEKAKKKEKAKEEEKKKKKTKRRKCKTLPRTPKPVTKLPTFS